MNTIKYETFLKVVEFGSITRAAEHLGYTQSAVSRIVSGLEQEWGLTLLTRNKNGVVLSSEGQSLLPQIRMVCNAHRELEQQVDALHGLTQGSIRIGTVTSISVEWLPEIMKSFLERYPSIHFELSISMEFQEIEEKISRGEVDCGFVALPTQLPLDTFFLRRDRILALLPADHPLAGAEYFPLERFEHESCILLDDDRDQEMARIFQRCGLHPHIRYRVNDDHAIISMVSSGLGVSILPELVLANANRPIAARPLDRPQFRDIALAVKDQKNLPPITGKFVSHTRHILCGSQD